MSSVEPNVGLARDEMAQRVAADIPDGAYVNLGIGIPELITKFVPAGREFIYHTENGLLGFPCFQVTSSRHISQTSVGKGDRSQACSSLEVTLTLTVATTSRWSLISML